MTYLASGGQDTTGLKRHTARTSTRVRPEGREVLTACTVPMRRGYYRPDLLL